MSNAYYVDRDGRRVVVEVDVTPVVEESGLWCDACLLPSVLRLRCILTLKSNPLCRLGVVRALWCDDHGAVTWRGW